MIIDAHHHFWKYDPVTYAWIDDRMQAIARDFNPHDLEPVLEKNQVDGAITVQVEETLVETKILIEIAEGMEQIKAVVGWVDLKDPKVENDLISFKTAHKLKGFRAIMQGSPDEQYLKNKGFISGVKKLKDHDFTYDILIYHDQIPSTLRFLEQCPDQPFILDHIAKPDIRNGEIRKWKENMKELSSFPDLYCKLSGIITEAKWDGWRYEDLSPYLDVAGEYFGTDRLCYGSDWPVCLLAGQYEEVLGVVQRFLQQVTPVEQEKVLSGNAMKFYKLA